MPRPTVRLRLTLLYAGVFLFAGAALLTVSYVLVRNNLTADHVTVGDSQADQLRRAIQHEVAGDALSRLRVQYALALAAMTALSVLLGWLVAGRALRPLQRITSAARLVSQDTLDERIALEGPRDELKELADTFDAMLERLSGAFASQRRFVANASHELRTPLTVMRTELEVTLADPEASNAELRSMAERSSTRWTAPSVSSQSLLTLARSEGAITRRDPSTLRATARDGAGSTPRAKRTRRGLAVHCRPAFRSGARRPAPARAPRREPRGERGGHNRARGARSVDTSMGDGPQRRRGLQRRRRARLRGPAALLEPFQRIDRGRPRRSRRPRPLDRPLRRRGPRGRCRSSR